jgi:hypothetical protein
MTASAAAVNSADPLARASAAPVPFDSRWTTMTSDPVRSSRLAIRLQTKRAVVNGHLAWLAGIGASGATSGAAGRRGPAWAAVVAWQGGTLSPCVIASLSPLVDRYRG